MTVWDTPERRALRDTVARFTEREIVPHLPRWEDEGRLPPASCTRPRRRPASSASGSTRRSAARAATGSTSP